MTKPLGIRTGAYFSGAIFYLGVGMILPGFFLINVYSLAVLPFFLISMVTLTTHYGLEVDVQGRCYREYVWLLGMKLGKWEAFERMEYIFIKRNKESQTIHSRISSRDLHYEVYDGYLRFSETNKVHMATARNRESLLNSLKPIARQLHLEIWDYSGGTPTLIPTT